MATTIRRILTAGAATVTLSLALAACATPVEQSPATSTTPTVTSSDASAAHNAADTEFAQMMIIHHQGAIEMADLAVQQAATPEVK
ncbi:MAG: DUF305 domain-containing protein, partial [Propionibacteriaceae bacterium]|nr:DUF305 domain-containing protein [Propionibacteriaceae bacterium]